MAVLTGFFVQSPLGGAQNPYLCDHLTAFNAREIIGWPPEGALIAPGAYAISAPTLPVQATGARALNGWRARMYSDDYYYRIHVAPPVFDFGNLVSAQTADFFIWNANFEPRTLLETTGVGEGVSIAPPAPLPLRLATLKESLWKLSVTPDGPSTIDETIGWRVDVGEAPTMRLIGNRIVPWGFAANWETPVIERLSWLTDVRVSTSGAEQRRALRIAPRRGFEFSVVTGDEERAFFDLALAAWDARVFALPLWHDAQRLEAPLLPGALEIPCRTEGFDFRQKGLVFLRGKTAFDTEAAEILAVAPDRLTLKRPLISAWPIGTSICPSRAARLSERPEIVRHTDSLTTCAVSFDVTEPCDWPEAWPNETYRGLPVLAERPDESEDLTHARERLLLTIDNAVGLPAVTDTARRAFQVQQHRWLLSGRAAHAAWRSLIYALRGRQRAIWLPTHAEDMMLATQAAGTQMTIKRIGYVRFGLGTPGRDTLRIEMADGAVIYARVTGAAETGNTETLTIDPALPATIWPDDVVRISYLVLFRLADDDVRIEHLTDADGHARVSLTFRGVRDDLEAQ